MPHGIASPAACSRRPIRFDRPRLAAPALLAVVAVWTTTTLAQTGASGIKLTAPPRSIRTADAVPTATASAATDRTPYAPPIVTLPRPAAPSASITQPSPLRLRSSSAVGLPAARIPTTTPQASQTPAPRGLFDYAARSRMQPQPTPSDPFTNSKPIPTETLPASPQGSPIKLGTDDDVFIHAPDDGYFGDSRFPYDPSERLDWTPQFLPAGLIYRSYLAGVKESRMATVFDHDYTNGWMWDITLGARVGLFRFGSTNPIRPEGFQVDLEGSAQPRLDLNNNEDLAAVDFRAGLPITYGIGRWATKFAFYHLSAHAGDEYMVRNPGFQRINYVRDEFVLGQSYYITDDLRLYAEAGWAFNADVAKPWEFQFGADYSPLAPSKTGSPFAAVNGYIRQEQNFSGNLVAQAGWQWRPWNDGKLLRIGVQYYNGKSNQFEFYDRFENKVGLGIWYDF